MRRFCDLFFDLDATTSTKEKLRLLKGYFDSAPVQDSVWALSLLMGNRLKRFLSSRDLHHKAQTLVDLPPWLYEESYRHVGDSAELISLLLAQDKSQTPSVADLGLSEFIETKLLPLKSLEKEAQLEVVEGWWSQLNQKELFILNKLVTGGFRVGVSKTLVIRALSEWSRVEVPTLTQRLMGTWEPTESFFQALIREENQAEVGQSPFPFYLAYPLEEQAELRKALEAQPNLEELSGEAWGSLLEAALGSVDDWQIEWKWDGIRCQLVKFGDSVHLWSRGEELVSEQFPELVQAIQPIEGDFILDGEVLAYAEGQPLHFSILQKRLGRKSPGAKTLKEAPVCFMAYDLLAQAGQDLRDEPIAERRKHLANLIEPWKLERFVLSCLVKGTTWTEFYQQRLRSRDLGVEGFMLKRKQSAYKVGRKKGDWWKWKVDPFTVDAVMLYAQPGSGRRANLYSDYTFAVWEPNETGELRLVPVAKAYSGLTDEEIRKVDHWIRRNTIEKFGPVRSVKPEQVFELAFEGISASKRHKSGVALRFPRIHRWRIDKPAEEADHLEQLKLLL